MRAAVLACAGLLVGSAPVLGQTIRAWVEPETVPIGQTTDLVVEIELTRLLERGVGEPQVPIIENARVVGRSRESRVTMAGASIARTSVYRYTILPIMPGALRIDPIRVEVGGRTLTTAPLRLLVLPSGDPPPRLDREPGTPEGPPPVFAVARLDRARAWVGEQVTLTFSFYHDPSHVLSESPDYDPPDTPGFWRIEIDKEPLVSMEQLGGRTYHVQRFRYALFPLRAGQLTVSSAKVRIVEPDRQRWWEPGGGRTITTDPLQVLVVPLPPAPAGFEGAVGSYDLVGELRPSATAAGTPVELELRVRGLGNPNAVGSPVLPEWPDIDVRPPSVDARIDATAAEGIRGEKTFRFLLVPGSPGRLSLGTARLPYFDPAAGTYRVDTLRLGEIVVSPAPPSGANTAPRASPEGPTLWAARAPVERRDADTRGLAGQPWTWVALAGPWGAWLLAAGARSAVRRHRRDPGEVAIARLDASRRRIAREGNPALEDAELALDDALRGRFGEAAVSAPPRERQRALARAGAPPELVAAVETARAAIAAARFGASGGPAAEADDALAQVARLLAARRGPPAAALLALPVAWLALIAAGSAVSPQRSGENPPFAPTPAAARAAWQAGNDAYRAGDFGAAARLYPLILETWADPRLEADLAAALWRGGRPGAAYAHYLHALALDPHASEVRSDAARLRSELGHPPDARGPLDRALGRASLDDLLALVLALNGGAFVAFLFSRRRPVTGSGRGPRRVAHAVLVLLLLAVAATALHAWTVGRPAWAVAGDRAPILAGPAVSDAAPPIGWLPAGSVARVLERGANAWRIHAPGHPAGWVARARIVPLHSRGPHAD